jgi:ribulose-phosphate 3-epimerase
MADIIPGINEQDLRELLYKAELVAPYSEWIQIDFSDDTLTSTSSFDDISALGASQKWTKLISKVQFEAHLMVNKPEKLLEDLVRVGFGRVIGHVECTDPRSFLSETMSYDIDAGFAIDADTEVETLEPYLEDVGCVLVMTAEAGPSGQPFQPELLEKVRIIHRDFPHLPIEVDNGINPHTAKLAMDAGASRIVSTSYIFKDLDKVKEAMEELKGEL